MTFAEYNTDEYFNNKDSTADGLVKAAYDEGKTREEVEKSLSPLWKEDKKGNVKKALDSYYKTETPKAEPKEEVKEEVKETETEKTEPDTEIKETTEIPVEEKTGIKDSDAKYMTDINAILNEEQKRELAKQAKLSVDNYQRTMENMERSGEAFKNINDRMVEQIPTFATKRFIDGEFGDPKSTDAKLRLAHFLVNGVASKLKQASNIAMRTAGKAPMFDDTTSDYEKYQQSNFAKGLENRWKKYEAETDSAIKMVQDRNVSEEDAINIINKISMNNRLQTAFNMADANKKAYMIEVLSKIGDKVTNWNDTKFVNALIGAEMTGEDVGSAAALIGTRAGAKVLGNLNLIDENGNIDLSALKNIKDLPGVKDAFSKAGINLDEVNLDGEDNGNPDSLIDEKKTGDKWKNPTGNLKGYKALDGKTYDFNTFEDKAGKQTLIDLINDLSKRFYNGEIDAETFRKHYNILAAEAGKHRGIKVENVNDNLKRNVNQKLKDLNTKTKSGEVTVDDYKAATAKVLDMANDVGMTEKEIQKLKKDFIKESNIKYKGKK